MIQIGPYVVDAVMTEEHTLESEVSTFPVENGSNFSDNIRVKNRRYRLTGVVSDHPLDLGFRSIEDDGTPLIDTSTKPSTQAKQALEGLVFARKPITIISSMDTYKNMVITSLTFTRDPDTGEALVFSGQCEQIEIVDNTRRRVRINFKAVDVGTKTAHPPNWVGTDKLGRDILVDPNKRGPGVEPHYLRADGTDVPPEEAAEAARKQGSVLTKFDKSGTPIPVSKKDTVPLTPRQKKPFWAPINSRSPFTGD